MRWTQTPTLPLRKWSHALWKPSIARQWQAPVLQTGESAGPLIKLYDLFEGAHYHLLYCSGDLQIHELDFEWSEPDDHLPFLDGTSAATGTQKGKLLKVCEQMDRWCVFSKYKTKAMEVPEQKLCTWYRRQVVKRVRIERMVSEFQLCVVWSMSDICK